MILQDGAVIGSDGFGFARRPDGTHHKIPQIGGVVIEDDVEIGANTTIDRPAVGETRIGAGTKIDNLVQIAHGVTIGRNVLLAAQVGVAGSVTIEDDVTLAGQVGVAGHITLGKGVVATAQTGIPNSVDAGAFISGYPAIANRDWLRASAVFRKLAGAQEARGRPRAPNPGAGGYAIIEVPCIRPLSAASSRSRTAFALLALVGWIAIEPAPNAAVRPPKLDYKMTTLENGLKVVLLEDHSTPIVHAEIWYHVGSKNEKKGRTGFAHLFEHMMFKGSKNVEPEGHPSRISSIGGQSNASTNEDATIFWETFPAQYLPMVLWLEADRMATLRIDEKVFETEREVVKEERRMRVENQPYGKLNEIIYDQAFTTHPYKHPTIGSMADLEAASIEDVRDFFKTYYVPDNATLVLVGDFESEGSDGSRQQLPRTGAEGDPARAARHSGRTAAGQGTPRPRSRRTCRCRRSSSRTTSPTTAIPTRIRCTSPSKVLSDGQSSRIYRKLVYEEQMALAAFGQGNIIEDPNLFYAVAIVQRGRSPGGRDQGAHRRARSHAQSEPITAAELQQAKNQFARDYILSRESNQDKARAARARRRHPQRHHDRGRRVRRSSRT